jgi:hypothetical protein
MSASPDSSRDQREQLHQRVRAHLDTLRESGLPANRTIALGGSLLHGWLIDDPFAQVTSRRWLLTADGDVWCEAAYVATPWSADRGVAYGWLLGPSSALDAVLELSADEARNGSGGLLAGPSSSGAPHKVADRRRGPERRSGDASPDGGGAARETGREGPERRSGADRRRA